MPPQKKPQSVAQMLRKQQHPGRLAKTPAPEKEPKPKTIGMAMSVEDMAEELAIGRSIAYQLIQQPDFPSFTIGRRVLVSRKGLQEWIDRQCSEKPETLMEHTIDTD